MNSNDAQIEAFLDEALPPEQMAALDDALRHDTALADRVAAAVGRRDAGLHTLGAIWRRRRLTCPAREQLGSYLLAVLDPQLADYVQFHLETIACRTCQASLADLRAQHAASDEKGAATRQTKYFQSSAGYLSGHKRR